MEIIPKCARMLSRHGHILKKIIIMKLTVIFFIALCLNASAKIYAQNVNLSENNMSLQSIFKKITKQTEYRFLYTRELLKGTNSVNINVTNKPLKDVLKQIFADQPITYVVYDKVVVIKDKGTESPTTGRIERVITGQVVDERGGPLPGVTVNEKNTHNTTVTEKEGNYKLTVNEQAILVFSYVGFKPQEIQVGVSGSLNVQLQPSMGALNEVVVVGYGKQKQTTITGAVSVVSGKDLTQTPLSNVTNMLVGRTSGISAVQSSGEPGMNAASIRIRGIATLNGSDPLIVIDGIQQPAEQPYTVLNAMDAYEIETISILKDASATAVYGIRGANGVIIITTKRGKINGLQLSFTANQGFTKAASLFQTVNSAQFAQLRNEAVGNAQAFGDHTYDQLLFTNDEIWKFQNNRDYTPAEVNAMGALSAAQKTALLNSPALYYTSHNYYHDQFDGLGRQQQYNLNVSGGTDKVKYFNSLGYFQQNGILSNSSFGGANVNPKYTRFNFRSNFDINVAKNFQLTFNIAAQSSINQVPGANNSASDFGNRYQNIIQNILENSPFSGPGIVNGHLVTSFVGLPGDATNPLGAKGGSGYTPLTQLLTAGTITMYGTNLTSNLTLKHTMNYLAEGLEAHATISYDDSYNKGFARINSIPQYSAMRDPSDPSNIVFMGGQVNTAYTADNIGNSSWRKVYAEAGINYNHNFSGHSVSALLLGNAQRYTSNSMSYNAPSGLMGVVGRVTYNYNERYLLESNLAYNGTEQFAPGHRFGLFPAVSAGWIVSNEPYFPKNNWLTLVKFRGSYGEVGNDQLNNRRYLYLPNTWGYTGYGYYFGNADGSSANPYYSPAKETALGNPMVTWERAKKTNLSADFQFFKSRLSVTSSLFWETRNNILVTLGIIPGTYGVASSNVPPANVGRVSNHGFELEAGWADKIGKFNYFVKGNFSYAVNKVEYKAEANYPYPWMNDTGYPIGQYKGLLTNGFYNTQQELNNRPYNTYGNNARLGDLKFVDVNGDGTIDQKDVVPIGYPNLPEVAYNWTVGFSYKGFDLSALFIGTAKGSFPQFGYILSSPFAKNVGEVLQTTYDGHWTAAKYAAGEKITYPEISFSGGGPNNAVLSDFWLKSNDFTRLKNLEVGYTFPSTMGFLKKAKIKGMRLYLNGNNLVTWGSALLKGIDPEQADAGKNSMGYLYPLTRVYNIGASIQL
ncbi:TonB-dependent receptor [Mucilaginibacter sp. OK268]|uniref:TonB-dependent receptor n=1 Tax=Mucilaginibacter sp. OK268 TaxID=1881048 RepID=UPI000B847FD3|nr:TonB-dependent receptor [Mucilaginibacter sp. OK268]